MTPLFYTLVWGEWYIKCFLEYTLPIIYPFVKSIDHKYIIETTPEDEKYLKTQLPDFEIRVTDFKRLNTYVEKYINEKFNELLNLAFEKGYALQVIAPDVFYYNLDVAYWKVVQLKKNCAVLPIGAIRVNQDEFLSEFSTALSVEEVHKLVVKHLHEETKAHYIDTDNWFTHPTMMIFPDFTIHSFIHRGWFIRPDRKNWFNHLEFDAVDKFIKDKESIYYIPDISEGYEFSLSPKPKMVFPENKFNPVKFAEMMNEKTNGIMRECFKRGYRVYGKEGDKAMVDKILGRLIT